MFARNFKKYKFNVAIKEENKEILYSDLLKYSKLFKKILKQNNLVFLICQNKIGSIISYTSLINNKFPVCLIDSNISDEDLVKLLFLYEPKYVICNSKKKIEFLKLRLNRIFELYDFFVYENIKSKKFYISKKILLLLSTSGSLNEPKFVKLSKKNLECNTKGIIKYLYINSSDVTISTMPMHYSYGLSVINTHLYSGGKIILTEEGLFSKKFYKIAKKEGVTNFNGVPFIYEILLKIGFEKIIFKSLRFITQAGGFLLKDKVVQIYSLLKNKDISFYLMYGQTEASPRISYLLVNDTELKKVNLPVGKPVIGGKLYLSKKKEIIFTGPNIFGGYANNYKGLNNFKKITKLFTQDVGFRNENNEIYIAGRLNRTIKVFGHRVNLDYLEKKIEYIFKCNSAVIYKNKKIIIFSEKKIDLNKLTNLKNNVLKNIVLSKIPVNKNMKKNYLILQSSKIFN